MFATILFILILSFLVLIHELGHYLAARWAKVKVEEFGLGYPPKALTLFVFQNTPFTLNWVPFGGFVKMEGEEGPVGTAETTDSDANNNQFPFYSRSAFQRLVILLAGVAMNFIFGIIAFAIVYFVMGIPTFIDEARIQSVAAESPAALAGVPADVNIIAFRIGQETLPTVTNQEVIEFVAAHKGEEVTLVTSGNCDQFACQESAHEYTLRIRTDDEIPSGQGALGVAFETQIFVQYPWYEQIVRGVVVGLQQALFLGVLIVQSLGTLVGDLFSSGQVPAELAGPVGIVHQAQTEGIFSQGPLMTLNFAGLLSVNLAVMNLLPIPALDGGRVLFIALEKIIGKKRVQSMEGYAHYFGFTLLIGLIVLVTIRDVWRLFI